MNFLLDYKPQAFLELASGFVGECLSRANGQEALSLFITSLSDENVCLTKYPAPRTPTNAVLIPTTNTTNGAQADDDAVDLATPPPPLLYDPAQKVNIACMALQAPLLAALQSGIVSALQPCLCTFAKQTPPLLVDALRIIEEHLVQQAPEANLRALLIGPSGQVCICACVCVCVCVPLSLSLSGPNHSLSLTLFLRIPLYYCAYTSGCYKVFSLPCG